MAALARAFRGCRVLMSPASAAGAKKPAALAKAAKAATAEGAKPTVARSGIMKPVPVSDALRRFAGGAPEISRAGAVKLLWDHIKANGLQNPAKKSEINCDEKLRTLFGGRDKVGMMEMPKLLNVHFVKN